MTDKHVNTDWFLIDPLNFPWHLYDGIPKTGTTHSYLCSMLKQYGEHNEQSFLAGRPSWRELQKNDGKLSKVISEYCRNVYSFDRRSSEAEVLGFLRRFAPFKEDFQKKIDTLYFSGRMSVPDHCKPDKE